jgi:HrpA-like RNA helicase
MNYKTPFAAPMDRREEANAARRSFSVDWSDHLTDANAISAWRKLRCEQGATAARNWCRKNFLSMPTLEMLDEMIQQFERQLTDIGFVASRGRGRGAAGPSGEQNEHAGNLRLVAGVVAAGLYPNIAKISRAPGTRKLSFASGRDGREEVLLHPRSANHGVLDFPAEWLVFHEKVKSSRVYLHDSTLVTPYPLLLFGGRIETVYAERRVVMDGWMRFTIAPQTAALLSALRRQIDGLLARLVTRGHARKAEGLRSSEAAAEEDAVALLIHLISTEFEDLA